MKIKLAFIFGLLLTFSNCTDPLVLKQNTRVLVNGKVENGDGVPILDAEILVYAKKGPGYPIALEEDKNILGSNFSDSEGNFSVTSILAIDDEFTVEVKATEDYSLYVYQTDTEQFVPSNLVFNIPTVKLYKKAIFNYSINKTSGNDNSLRFWFNYVDTYCFEVYDSEGVDYNQSNCPSLKSFVRNLDVNNPNLEDDFKTRLGSVVEFTYSLNGASNITELIPINDLNYEFTFNY